MSEKSSPAIEKASSLLDATTNKLVAYTYAEMIFSTAMAQMRNGILRRAARAQDTDPARVGNPPTAIRDDAGDARVGEGEETVKVKSWAQWEADTAETLADLESEVRERRLESYVDEALKELQQAEERRIKESLDGSNPNGNGHPTG